MDVMTAGTAEQLAEAVRAEFGDYIRTLDSVGASVLAAHWEAISVATHTVDALVRSLVTRTSYTADSGKGDPRTTRPADSGEEVRELATQRWVGLTASGWVSKFGFGTGTATALAATVRELIPGVETVAAPSATAGFMTGVPVARIARLQLAALAAMDPPLTRVAEQLALSDEELGSLFGVTRQAVQRWRAKGVPTDRLAALADISSVVSLLDRKLSEGSAPLVARRPAPAFGGRTLLESLAENPARTREAVEKAFDFSTAA